MQYYHNLKSTWPGLKKGEKKSRRAQFIPRESTVLSWNLTTPSICIVMCLLAETLFGTRIKMFAVKTHPQRKNFAVEAKIEKVSFK
jgi:hypothetical protein